jgi:hypothetical protein
MDFLKKHGGTRTRFGDNVSVYPVCDCNAPMMRVRDGEYVCRFCGANATGVALRGRTWVSSTGTVVIRGAHDQA